MIRTLSKYIIIIVFTLFSKSFFAQSLNAINFPMTTSFGNSLEDMSGGTIIINQGNSGSPSSLTNFGSGFVFNFCGIDYTGVSVSPNGWVKLGSDGILEYNNNLGSGFNEPKIAPYWSEVYPNNSGQNVTYKMTGAAPNRKFIIEWDVTNLQFSWDPVKFQLWLYETSNVVEFVYDQIPVNTQNYSRGFDPINGVLSINWSSGVGYWASYIAANNSQTQVMTAGTKFRFSPEIIPPSNLTFSAVMAGCYTLNWVDSSINEESFKIYKSLDNINFNLIATVPTTTQTSTGTIYSFEDDLGNSSNTTYYYRIFAKNQISVSANYLEGNITTGTSFLSGVKNIPGDYSSITEVFNDLKCLYLGDTLILELQQNYDCSNEIFPIVAKLRDTLNPNYIIIRPALGVSNIDIRDSNISSILEFNNIHNLIIDGRPGGLGLDKELSIINDSSGGKTIEIKNNSNSNLIQFCNIRGEATSTYSGIITFGGANTDKNKNNTINSCNINGNTPYNQNGSSSLIYAGSSSTFLNTAQNDSNSILNCNFYNYGRDNVDGAAVFIRNGCSDWTIDGNSFYDTTGLILTNSNYRDIIVGSGGNNIISNNYFGGTQPMCGGAPLRFNNNGFASYNAIGVGGNNVIISNNKISNMEITLGFGTSLIYVFSNSDTLSEVIIRDNIIGADTNGIGFISINLPQNLQIDNSLILAHFKRGIIHNNSFRNISSNINTYGSEFYLMNVRGLLSPSSDSIFISNNKFGGNINIASDFGAILINNQPGDSSTVVIESNNIENIVSSKSVFGVSSSNNYSNFIIRNNIIRDVEATSVQGIFLYSIYSGGNIIKNNKIHSFNKLQNGSTGISTRFLGSSGNMNNIYENIIHSFSKETIGGANITGAEILGVHTNFFNNNINLGRSSIGVTDTNSNFCGLYVTKNNNRIFHNSIYIGDSILNGNRQSYCIFLMETSSLSSESIDINNNILINKRGRYIGADSLNTCLFYDSQVLGNSSIVVPNIDYNLYYNSNIGEDGSVWFNSVFYYNDLNWISRDAHSVYGESGFINPNGDAASIDMHVSGVSFAENRGVSGLAVNTDIDNENRNVSYPDIGSDEFDLITGLGAVDVALCSIDSMMPTMCYPDSVDIFVTIANYGLDSLTDVDIIYEINGVIQDTMNWQGLLFPNDSLSGILIGAFYYNQDEKYEITCYTSSPNDTIDVNISNDYRKIILPRFHVLNLGLDSSICENAEFTLNAFDSSYVSYLWNNASTLSTLLINNNIDSVSLTVIDNNGCIYIDSVLYNFITISPLDLGVDSIFSCDTLEVNISAYNPSFNQYFWSTGDTLSEITVLTPSQTINIVVIDTNGCIQKDTVIVNFLSCISIQEYFQDWNIKIYPLPVKSTTTIELDRKYESIQIEMVDFLGKTILEQKFNHIQKIELNLENLSNGVYFTHVRTSKNQKTLKIIKQD